VRARGCVRETIVVLRRLCERPSTSSTYPAANPILRTPLEPLAAVTRIALSVPRGSVTLCRNNRVQGIIAASNRTLFSAEFARSRDGVIILDPIDTPLPSAVLRIECELGEILTFIRPLSENPQLDRVLAVDVG